MEEELDISRKKLAEIDIDKMETPQPFNMLYTAFQYADQKENLHSEFLAGLLNPLNSDHEDDCGLWSFLWRIGVNNPTRSVKVETKRNVNGRQIDIFIEWQDENKQKHAVIIINKFNGAADQPNQLNDYYNGITQEGYLVEKLVYLCFTAHNPSYAIEEGAKFEIIDLEWLLEWIDDAIKCGWPYIEDWTENCRWIINRYGLIYQYEALLQLLQATKYTYMKAKEIIEKFSIDEINKIQNIAKIINTPEWSEALFSDVTEQLQNEFGDKLEFKSIYRSADGQCYIKYFFNPYKYWIELWAFEEHISLYVVSDEDESESYKIGKINFSIDEGNIEHYYRYSEFAKYSEFAYPKNKDDKKMKKLLDVLIPTLTELSKYEKAE